MPPKTNKQQSLEFNPIGQLVNRNIVDEMQEAYLDYAMSVIVSRALPDVRDGLKPVHRRILYVMWKLGLKAGGKFRKSAAVVGEVLGNFHPHGDTPVYDAMVRMAQDFAMRYRLVAGQGNFGCFTKDTRVKLTDGRDLSFDELICEQKKGIQHFTYTINNLGLISIAEIRHPRKTRIKASLIRITLDNGESVRCTPDHLFMTRTGEYKKASDLLRGDSLMPLYQKYSTIGDRLNREGYLLVHQLKKNEWVPAHHLADNYNLTHGIYAKSVGRVRHHVDFNKLNNNPDNIRRVGWKEHFDIHAAHASFKRRVTNNTGKVKFLRVCREALKKKPILTREFYEKVRLNIYPYGMATSWEKGLKKYFQGNNNLLLQELHNNHKIVNVENLSECEDVYDLTIEGTHNFALACGVFVHNSMDGDSAAAMRYTEAKLAKIAEEMLIDIEKQTVAFVPNYDATQNEPVVLPSRIPNLLLNGTVGIAVGMATSIPPHNLGELCDALTHLIDCKQCSVDDLTEFVKGPDFPTGGIIYDVKAIKQAYATGRGGVVIRAKTDIIESKSGAQQIIVHEIPFQVNKASVLEKIAELVREKKIEGIRDLRDESSKGEVRMVIELKRDTYPKKILNQLFKYTQLQDTFHFNILALVDGIQPRTLNLKAVLDEFLKHRKDVIVKRTQYDLDRAKERAHILEGLHIALEQIDKIIKTIKQSRDREAAKVNLMKQFRLSERQSIAILEMRLSQLANLERLKIEQELKEKRALIKELESILSSPKKIMSVIKQEIQEVRHSYGDERKTQIIKSGVDKISTEDLIPNEQALVVLTQDGYIKRLPPDTFKLQARGGKGVVGLTTKEEDIVDKLFNCMTHNDILFFTTRGRVFQLKAYEVPVSSRTAKGQAVVNFLQLGSNEKVSAVISLEDVKKYKYLIMVTRQGLIKKTDMSDFTQVRRSGLIAIKLKGDDLLEWVRPTTGSEEIMLVSALGQSIHFKESTVRSMGRAAAGVRGMKLKRNDVVVGMEIVRPTEKGAHIMVVMEKGFGKQSPLKEYKLQNRGGSGIKTAKITSKTGVIVMAAVIPPQLADTMVGDLLSISSNGQVIRFKLSAIPKLGRDTQGVRVMRFKEDGDKIASVTLL